MKQLGSQVTGGLQIPEPCVILRFANLRCLEKVPNIFSQSMIFMVMHPYVECLKNHQKKKTRMWNQTQDVKPFPNWKVGSPSTPGVFEGQNSTTSMALQSGQTPTAGLPYNERKSSLLAGPAPGRPGMCWGSCEMDHRNLHFLTFRGC